MSFGASLNKKYRSVHCFIASPYLHARAEQELPFVERLAMQPAERIPQRLGTPHGYHCPKSIKSPVSHRSPCGFMTFPRGVPPKPFSRPRHVLQSILHRPFFVYRYRDQPYPHLYVVPFLPAAQDYIPPLLPVSTVPCCYPLYP